MESLLVQCADWGINVRMFLNGDVVELDLMKNYEGDEVTFCLLYTSPSPRDMRRSRMPSSA